MIYSIGKNLKRDNTLVTYKKKERKKEKEKFSTLKNTWRLYSKMCEGDNSILQNWYLVWTLTFLFHLFVIYVCLQIEMLDSYLKLFEQLTNKKHTDF